MELGVCQSPVREMRRTLFSCLGPCSCAAWCAGGVCVVRGVGPYRRHCDEHVPCLRWRPGAPQGGFQDGACFKGGLGRCWRVLSVVDVPVIISDKLQQSKSYVNVEVHQIQFIVTVLDIPVATQRRFPTVVEVPQVQFLDKVVNSVVVQRLVTGCDRAENCGGSAVACYDKVVDVPVVQFIDGLDVPVIMQRRRSRDSEGATDSVHRRSRGRSSRHRDGSAPSVYDGDEGFFRVFFRIFRAPPGCPGVERQFSEFWTTRSSSSSRGSCTTRP